MPEPKANGRERLEVAVKRTGKAIDDLVRAVERGAVDLDQASIDGTFQFLSQVLSTAHQKARLSLNVGIASAGGFSLEKLAELQQQSPAVAPMVDPGQRAERIVGERRGPGGARPQNRLGRPLTPEERQAIEDAEDGVSFEDE